MSELALGGVLCFAEQRYVAAVNAVLAAPGDSTDVDRWRGQAEAYRAVCEELRKRAGLRFVRYQGPEWRDANGVYTREYLAELRGEAHT